MRILWILSTASKDTVIVYSFCVSGLSNFAKNCRFHSVCYIVISTIGQKTGILYSCLCTFGRPCALPMGANLGRISFFVLQLFFAVTKSYWGNFAPKKGYVMSALHWQLQIHFYQKIIALLNCNNRFSDKYYIFPFIWFQYHALIF